MEISLNRSTPPLVVLWSTPRSASTALGKSIMQHPNVDMLHEPFTDCYYFGPERCSSRYGNCQEKKYFSRSSVYDVIHRPCEVSDEVRFIKELAFQALPYLTDSFLRRCRHIFLINEPHAVYASLVKLKPNFTEDEFGFSALYSLYQRVKRLQSARPMVCTTRQLLDHPEHVLANVCEVSGIAYTPAILRWEPGPIRRWKDHEQDSQTKWHKSTETSEGFMPYREPDYTIEIASEARVAVNNAYKVFRSLSPLADNYLRGESLEHAG